MISFLFFLIISLALCAVDSLWDNSDEFTSPASLGNWLRLEDVEGWPNRLLTYEISGGSMVVVPHTTSWYDEFIGPLIFKPITGNFVFELRTTTLNRAGTGAPSNSYSLAGAFLRTPTGASPPPGLPTALQNYVFLSLGAANVPGTFQMEVKSTIDSDSTLSIDAAPGDGSTVIMQFVRLGRTVLALRATGNGDQWEVHRRYSRSDFPATLQVGMCAYTDWDWVSSNFNCDSCTCSTGCGSAFDFNNRTIPAGVIGESSGTMAEPDIRASFDYARFATAVIPDGYTDIDFLSETATSDEYILSLFGPNVLFSNEDSSDSSGSDSNDSPAAALLSSLF